MEVVKTSSYSLEDFACRQCRGVDGEVAVGVRERENMVPDERGKGVFIGVEVKVGMLY